ncbi:hypothetical protein [Flagellimonas pacifica]|uniref:MerT mercuric transport protein n=1 Tax=Flagellimonas pacifica TaxID=1247520 RepID=A0A285MXX9_9FLAO|nr:hypothetical protein [Allomuricauda parva]SNZ01407.1 MerT mercuric transport protein [Allomuricauda parva]
MKGLQFQDSIATGTSLLTFLAPKVCCWNGAIAALSSGTSYLAWVYPLRPYLFGLALLSLVFGFYREYYPKKKDTLSCGSCTLDKNRVSRSKLRLWLVTLFVLITFAINYIAVWD